jgi:phenylacetate-coenzyme A ligase PaaK-like adenylate-forming protein
VFGERERLSRIKAEQERALTRYLRREVYAYSPRYPPELEAVGLDRGRIAAMDDLSRVPLTRLADIASEDQDQYVLQADDARISGYGEPSLALRLLWHRWTGRGHDARRALVDPLFKPVQWMVQDGIRWAYTAADLDQLGELGRRCLEHAGLRPADMILNVLPVGAGSEYWQVALGGRHGGVAVIPLEPKPRARVVEATRPTVIVGHPHDLIDLLVALAHGGANLPDLHTVLAAGCLLDEDGRAHLATLAAEVGGTDRPAVVAAWRPPGARAMWAECRGGSGFHTWPATEFVQSVDGEVVWSPIGWRGTVVLRVATGVHGVIDDSRCPTCGRTTPRVFIRGDNNGGDGG